METKDFEWFCEICRCGSISKAATNLYVSQQGLSKSIKRLEQQLGVDLFVRTPNGVIQTVCGHYLYEQAPALLKNLNDLTAELTHIDHREHGFLHLCSAYGILRILSPDFVFDFEKRYPGKALDYMEYPDHQVDAAMQRDEFDIAFHVEGEPMEGFTSMPMFSSTISLLVYEDHPLAQRESVSFRDLADEPLIIESKAFQIHDILLRECAKVGVEPHILFNTSGFSLCHKLCQQKRGISLVVDMISRDMTGTGLKKIPFEEPVEWNVALICREELIHNKEIAGFQMYVRHYLEELGLSAERS